jgi:hypothetical protein
VRAGGKQGVSDKEKRRKKKGESEKLINFAEMACAEEFPSMERGRGRLLCIMFDENFSCI